MNSIFFSSYNGKLLVFVAVLSIILLVSGGCATRGDVDRIITDLEMLKLNYSELGNNDSKTDSLLEKHLKTLRDLSTDLNYNLERINERLQLLDGKIEDLTMQQSQDSYSVITTQAPVSDNSNSADSSLVNTEVEVSAKQIYDTAYMDFIKGDYKIAVSGFKEYLKSNSKTPLADNAQFFIGECYYNLPNYNRATSAYNDLLKNYSKSEKAPDALLRMVEISVKRKDIRSANKYYAKLNKSFPNSPETERAEELSYEKKRDRH